MISVCSCKPSCLGPITIEQYNSMPTFFINGKPQPGMFHFSEGIPEHYATEFRKAGFILYSCIDKGYFLDLGWEGDGVFDFTRHDKVISTFAERIPDGYLLPKIHLWTPENYINNSEPMRQAFTGYLKNKYAGDINLLRSAWNDPDVAFENISIPESTERLEEHILSNGKFTMAGAKPDIQGCRRTSIL